MLLTKLLRRYLNLPDFVQNVSFVFGTQGVVFLAGGLSNVILARWLGPEGRGVFSLAVLVPFIIFSFLSLNLSTSITYHIGQKKHPCEQISGNALLMAVGIIAFTTAIYFYFLNFISQTFVKNVGTGYLKWSYMIFPIMLLTACLAGILQGFQRIKEVSSTDIAKTFTNLAFLALFLILLKTSIAGAIAATIISFLVGLVLMGWFVIRSVPVNFELHLGIMKDLFHFGIRAHLGTIAQFFNYRLDMLLINLYMLPSDVGIYSVSVLVSEFIWYIPAAMSQVLFPKISNSDMETTNRFTPQVCRTSLFATAAIAAVLFIVSRPLLSIVFGSQFIPAVIPLQILLPGTVALGLAKILSSDLAGRGRPEYATYTAVASLVVTIILNVLLIPRLGVAGAALASTVSYATSAFILSVAYSRISGNSLFSFILINREDLLTCKSLIKRMV